jgi:hypothetical protein
MELPLVPAALMMMERAAGPTVLGEVPLQRRGAS